VESFANKIHNHDDSNQAEDADDEEDFAGGNPSGSAALTVGDGAFVKFDEAPNDEDEGHQWRRNEPMPMWKYVQRSRSTPIEMSSKPLKRPLERV